MKATDEQIVQLRSIPDTCKCTDCRKQREALAAVLAELATLREENKGNDILGSSWTLP